MVRHLVLHPHMTHMTLETVLANPILSLSTAEEFIPPHLISYIWYVYHLLKLPLWTTKYLGSLWTFNSPQMPIMHVH